MTITTRIITEDHKKYIVTLDEEGKRIGKRQKWHGESIQSEIIKQKIQKEAQHYEITKSEPILTKKSKQKDIEVLKVMGEVDKKDIRMKIDNWIKEGFTIPKGGKPKSDIDPKVYNKFKTGTRFTELNTKAKFEYTIRMRGYRNDDKKDTIDKIVTILSNEPLTRKQIQESLLDIIKNNKDDKYLFGLKSFGIINLLLNKYATYNKSYKDYL